MDLILLVLVIALVGFGVWAVTTYIPMPPPFKIVIQVIAVVALVLYALRGFGVALPNVLH